MLPGQKVHLELDLDGEGVVRVRSCDAAVLHLSPDDLAELLTGLLKAFTGTSDGEEEVDVLLN